MMTLTPLTKVVCTIFFTVAVACATANREQTLDIRLAGEIDRVSFDRGKVSVDELKKWIQLSPNVSGENFLRTPESVESCVPVEGKSRQCSQDPQTREFQ